MFLQVRADIALPCRPQLISLLLGLGRITANPSAYQYQNTGEKQYAPSNSPVDCRSGGILHDKLRRLIRILPIT